MFNKAISRIELKALFLTVKQHLKQSLNRKDLDRFSILVEVDKSEIFFVVDNVKHPYMGSASIVNALELHFQPLVDEFNKEKGNYVLDIIEIHCTKNSAEYNLYCFNPDNKKDKQIYKDTLL